MDAGNKGPLLPRSLFNELKPLARRGDPDVNDGKTFPTPPSERSLDMYYDIAHVEGIRIDPCFIEETTGPGVCHRQIRLIWKPLSSEVFDGYHSFFELTDKEFTDFVKELARLDQSFGALDASLPLQRNPRFTNEKYAPALKELLLRYIGIQNLIRFNVTILSDTKSAFDWSFAGIEKVGGKFQRVRIPGTEGSKEQIFQSHVKEATSDDGFVASMLPDLDASNPIPEFVRYSQAMAPAATADVYRAFTLTENPKAFTVQQVDCISCHIANSAKSWMKNKIPSMKDTYSKIDETNGFKSTWPSAGSSFDRFPSISVMMFAATAIGQRVVNESSVVADQMKTFMETVPKTGQ